jgi:4-amino-4-deoxy-L-arabinose transferase-like glycosyltransferase
LNTATKPNSTLLSIFKQPLLLVFLMALVAYIPGLGNLNLFYGDEIFYIKLPKSGAPLWHSLVPVYESKLHLAKPPFLHLIIATFYDTFGISLFVARLPSLICSLIMLFFTYKLAFLLFNSKFTAQISCLALVSSHVFFQHAKLAITDMSLCAALLAGSYFLSKTLYQKNHNQDKLDNIPSAKLDLFLASLCFGLAGLIKGHVGIVLSLLIILSFFVLDRLNKPSLNLKLILSPGSVLPFILLSSLWFIFLLTCQEAATTFAPLHPKPEQSLKQAFLDYFYHREITARPSGGILEIFTNFVFYSLALIRVIFPWSILIIIGFFFGKKILRDDYRNARLEYQLLAALIVPILLFFIVVIREQTRLRYLLPITPAICIVAARYLFVLGQQQGRSLLKATIISSASLLLIFNLVFNLALPSIFPRAQELALNALKGIDSIKDPDQTEVVFIAQAGDRKKENLQTFMSAILGRIVVRQESFDSLSAKTKDRYIIAPLESFTALGQSDRYSVLDTIRVMKQWTKWRHFEAAMRGQAERIEFVVLKELP